MPAQLLIPPAKPAAPRHFYQALLLLTALTAALVNPGNMGSVDPVRRLQQAHSWWTGEPELDGPPEARGIGTMDPQGRLRATFGMGHGLILLPADLLATGAIRAAGRVAPLDGRTADLARQVMVAFLTQTFIGWAALSLAYLLLRALGFPHGISALSTLSLLFATTFLHYVQTCQENNLMLALVLAGCYGWVRWLDTGAGRYAALAGAAAGYGLLIRLTTLADAGGALVFLAVALWWGPRRPLRSLAWFLPPFLAGGGVERWYQHLRFGVWSGSYYSSDEVARRFSQKFMAAGLAESLWTPQNSIFLYDLLLPLTLVLFVAFWAATAPRVRALAVGALAALAVSVVFHSTYLYSTGEDSWGARLVQTPVHLLCLLAVPLLWSHWSSMGRSVRALAVGLMVWSVVQQIASLLLMMSLEVQYAGRFGWDWSIPRRFHHIWLVLSGAADRDWWLATFPAEWRRWTLLPAQLGLRFPVLARIATVGWLAMLAAFLAQVRGMLHQAIGGPPLARLAEVFRAPRAVPVDGRTGA